MTEVYQNIEALTPSVIWETYVLPQNEVVLSRIAELCPQAAEFFFKEKAFGSYVLQEQFLHKIKEQKILGLFKNEYFARSLVLTCFITYFSKRNNGELTLFDHQLNMLENAVILAEDQDSQIDIGVQSLLHDIPEDLLKLTGINMTIFDTASLLAHAVGDPYYIEPLCLLSVPEQVRKIEVRDLKRLESAKYWCFKAIPGMDVSSLIVKLYDIDSNSKGKTMDIGKLMERLCVLNSILKSFLLINYKPVGFKSSRVFLRFITNIAHENAFSLEDNLMCLLSIEKKYIELLLDAVGKKNFSEVIIQLEQNGSNEIIELIKIYREQTVLESDPFDPIET